MPISTMRENTATADNPVFLRDVEQDAECDDADQKWRRPEQCGEADGREGR